ncbi:hypothetical protein SAMD00019534_031880 [Acytostelium subglobosum LB1]|uniref:hypothetical protein n=1 Tax=Acytostelium subglobosum LB1 TaxID=1410327 RepID=UPI000644B663|nr:hypothetical protein SAMD00019534_031880 [Acytostelium subglobosum LB1]GAM20013.1 hypothetical protein SAMD00019534_031880 [Acytostelium subglobosum LB1]|eukprot:XP_012756775.1 hypothetical protein SAMD00019534_031880 [Acytostelium subglobosum LB1]
MQISHKRVANQFRELHEILMREERRAKEKLDEELDRTTTSINNIISEIGNLTARATHNNNVNDGEGSVGDVDDRMNQLVQSIQTSKSMDQFIDKQFNPFDDGVTFGDDQLLDFVRRGSQATQTDHYFDITIRLNSNSYLLERGIKEQIDKYSYHEEPTMIDHGFRNHIFSLWKDSCSMLSLDTGEWTVIDDKCTPRERIFRSVVGTMTLRSSVSMEVRAYQHASMVTVSSIWSVDSTMTNYWTELIVSTLTLKVVDSLIDLRANLLVVLYIFHRANLPANQRVEWCTLPTAYLLSVKEIVCE